MSKTRRTRRVRRTLRFWGPVVAEAMGIAPAQLEDQRDATDGASAAAIRSHRTGSTVRLFSSPHSQ